MPQLHDPLHQSIEQRQSQAQKTGKPSKDDDDGDTEDKVVELPKQYHGGPISVEEFEAALKDAWTPLPATSLPDNLPPTPPYRIGLAISGGVDSMALAKLCHQLQQAKPQEYSFHAIIIDHQARPGSATEALQVAKNLQHIGLPATIRTIEWPKPEERTYPQLGRTPAMRGTKVTAFERKARTLRYRYLGSACHELGLRYLLLGHHADDQVETVLARILFRSGTGKGLGGIKASAHIPECQGLWGVGEGPKTFRFEDSMSPNLPQRSESTWIAGPGITVHRPFLSFSKLRLRNTCESHGTPWVEDETNSDKTHTPRNTLRFVLGRKLLPKAVEETRLLQMSRLASMRNANRNVEEQTEFENLEVKQIDLHAGSMIIRLPLDESKLGPEPADSSVGALESQLRETLRRLLSWIYWLLAPKDTLPIHLVGVVVKSMVSSLGEGGHPGFTFGGVRWLRLDSQEPSSGTTWLLQRENPPLAAFPQPCFWSTDARVTQSSLGVAGVMHPFGTWQLFDARFWIKVETKRDDFVVVRMIDDGDVAYLRDRFKGDAASRKSLEDALTWGTDGKVQRVIPGLARDEFGPLVALPTLGLAAPEVRGRLSWEICYRAAGFISQHTDKLGRIKV